MKTTITHQPAPVVETPTDQEGVIELTISEVDRQEAENFCDIDRCLLCTALMNRGYNVFAVDTEHAFLDSWNDVWKFEEYMGTEALHAKSEEDTSKPFYGPGVVGKVIRLRRVS